MNTSISIDKIGQRRAIISLVPLILGRRKFPLFQNIVENVLFAVVLYNRLRHHCSVCVYRLSEVSFFMPSCNVWGSNGWDADNHDIH